MINVRRTLPSYVVSLGTTASAALANAALWPELGSRYPLIAFFPAIAVSSWFGGFWPGALSTALSALGASYLWFAPPFFASSSHQGDALVLIMFVGIGLTTASLFEALKRRTARAEQAERETVRLSKELHAVNSRLLDTERSARQEAERANRLKDEILATVSHELRTPLVAILGWVDVLKNGRADDINRKRGLEAIGRNARQQAQLLGELLDTSRIKSGTVRLNYDSVDLGRVTSEAWEAVAPLAEAKAIQACIDLDPAMSANVLYGDPARLQQVVANLFSNAVKFTPAGGQVTARVRQFNGTVEIVVSDTGRGIPQDFLPFVFEPFRQAEATKANSEGGVGLGLFIVKQLVEAHDGEVSVASDGEDRGASFTVRLPACPAQVARSGAR